jgi:expansin (peptidoglycan-binding protein)
MTPGSVANGTLNAKFVPCPVTGNLVYHVTTLQQYYVALVIMKTRYGIKSISYRTSGSTGAWTAMTAPTDADPHWVINSVAIPSAVDLQITSEWGQVVVDTNVHLTAGDVTSTVQFPTCS